MIFSLISLQMSNCAWFSSLSAARWCVLEVLLRAGNEVCEEVSQSCSPMIYLTLPPPDAQFGPVSVTPRGSCGAEFIHSKNSWWLQKQDRWGQKENPGCKWDENLCELRRSTSAAFSRKHCHGCETLNIYRRCSVGCTSRELSLTFYWTNIHFPTHAQATFGSVAHFTSRSASAREKCRLVFLLLYCCFFLCHVCSRAADQCVLILRTEKHQRWARGTLESHKSPDGRVKQCNNDCFIRALRSWRFRSSTYKKAVKLSP